MSEKIRFYCPKHLERWDYRSMDAGGIGGSETHVVEMAVRLAARGHDVAVYAPLKPDYDENWGGVSWRELVDFDPREDAIWLLQRCPESLLQHDWNGKLVVHLHDLLGKHDWHPDWTQKADKVLCQSWSHLTSFQRIVPDLNGRATWVGSGARVELFEELEAEGHPRNPHKLIWASDPARGLAQALLPNWERIRRFCPQAELHIFYGWKVQEGLADAGDPIRRMAIKELQQNTRGLIDQPGIYWHGRVGQRELYREWLTSAVWPMWTDFPEVCCIAALEAQCAGAIPVCTPWWALRENVRHGVFINGRPYEQFDSSSTQAFLVSATTTLLNNHVMDGEPLQKRFRDEMMPEARARCGWGPVVERWEEAVCS